MGFDEFAQNYPFFNRAYIPEMVVFYGRSLICNNIFDHISAIDIVFFPSLHRDSQGAFIPYPGPYFISIDAFVVTPDYLIKANDLAAGFSQAG